MSNNIISILTESRKQKLKKLTKKNQYINIKKINKIDNSYV